MPTITSRAAKASALLFAFAAAINLAAPTSSSALPKHGSGGSCTCICNTPVAGPNGQSLETITNPVASCDAYEGKTCNFEGSDGLIHTGSLMGCYSPNASNGNRSSHLPITPPLPTKAAPTSGTP
jgi:hypothetical protein